jgi:uncharacterized protein (TIGR02452 family)
MNLSFIVMDIDRLENMHRAQEVIDLISSGLEYKPSISIKMQTRTLLALDPEELDRPQYEETDIEIENIDTITAALREVAAGYRPLILNMANATKPGGGFLSGAKAQEEDLFRCTNLYNTLQEELYPMRRDEVIYSPKVHIFRDGNYENLAQPVEISVVSVAAHRNPMILMDGTLPSYIYRNTADKVQMIYQLGLMQRYDCLILGALGCGAFNNPPYEIAEIFCDITGVYAQKFKKIIFPIKCGNDNDNCEIFQDAFLEAFSEEK